MEPRYNQTLNNEVLDLTNDFFAPEIVKHMEKNLDIKKPRYSEQILPVPWHFFISRFHWMKWKEQTIFSTVSISALSWDAFFFSSALSWISRLLGYVHTILDRLSWRHEKLSNIVWTPVRYVTHHFRDRRVAASLRHRDGTATTVLICEQKPYPVYDFRGATKRYSV